MSEIIQTKGLTAWERWELASFDTQVAHADDAVPPAPTFSAEEIAALREQARQDGHREGYVAGHELGEAEGRREAQAAVAAEAGRLAGAATRLEQALGELDAVAADQVLALSLEIARQVVRAQIVARPDTLLNVVREALAQLPVQHAAIHLHPEDASLARSYAGDQLAHAGHRIQEDPRLQRGDVVVEAGSSHLDATVATRWQRVVAALGQDTGWLDLPAA